MKFLIALILVLVSDLPAAPQLGTSGQCEVILTRTFPPAPAPLFYSAVGTPIQGAFTSETSSLNAPVVLSPGTYRFRAKAECQAFCSHPGSSSDVVDFDLRFDIGSQFLSVLPTSSGRTMTCITELGFGGMPQHCFDPLGVGNNPFPITIPMQENSFGYSTPVYGVGQGFGGTSFSVAIDGAALRVRGRTISSSSYSITPWYGVPGVWVTAFLDIQMDFQVTQQLTIVIDGDMSCIPAGRTQAFPVLPQGGWQFYSAKSGDWFDPPMATAYDFQQTSGSLFTEILSLPVGVDGDGLFEVQVGGQSLGLFAEGTGVNFVQLLGSGVPAFRIAGIDPAKDSTDPQAFPVKLAFNTPTADFTMTPVTWRKVGSSCSEPVCTACPATTLAPIGDALAGNSGFGMSLQNGPTNGIAAWFVGIGSARPTPLPALCGSVHMPFPWLDVGAAVLPGTSSCDGAGQIPLPLPIGPNVVGTFLTVQSLTLCPQGGLGLTHAIEFAIGS